MQPLCYNNITELQRLILWYIVRFASPFSRSELLTSVAGAYGLYSLFSFTEPQVALLYVSTFMFACLVDLFDAIANQNYWAHEAYPNGQYKCEHSYAFPDRLGYFTLELNKVNAPNWDFTFADIGDDLTSIYNAIQFFETPRGLVPSLKIQVFRYRYRTHGPTFLGSQGGFRFIFAGIANLSVT